jgi:hypothetical protein
LGVKIINFLITQSLRRLSHRRPQAQVSPSTPCSQTPRHHDNTSVKVTYFQILLSFRLQNETSELCSQSEIHVTLSEHCDQVTEEEHSVFMSFVLSYENVVRNLRQINVVSQLLVPTMMLPDEEVISNKT